MLRALLPALALLLVAACDDAGRSRAPEPAGEGGDVVATIFPIADLAGRLVGRGGPVETLLPAGATPRSFEPTTAAIRKLERARLVLTVGAGLDAWVRGLVPPEGGRIIVLTRGMELVDDGHDEGAGTGNPHVWLDPVRVRDELLPAMSEALAGALPERAETIRDHAARWSDSLTALDSEIRERLAGAPTRVVLPTHAAWTYFGRRYGLRILDPVHPSPGREPSPRHLARIVREARSAGVRAVVAEPQLSPRAARALASELGVPVVTVDPLGGPAAPGRDTYLSLMRTAAARFATVLGKE